MPDIPPREPIGDLFEGVLLRYATANLLAPAPLHDTEVIFEGPLTVRYGIRYLEKLNRSIVPGLVAVDYGDFFTGAEMWEFIQTRHNMFPRAEVLGYRSDGEDDMVALKWLDFDAPRVILAYDAPDATQPLATVHALIASVTVDVPQRLLDYLPRYDTLADWTDRERH